MQQLQLFVKWSHFREWDEVDNEIIEVTKQVSEYACPGTGKPTYDNILTGYNYSIAMQTT